MSTIKPLDPLSSAVAIDPSQADLSAPAVGAGAQGGPVDPTRRVLAELAAGQISPSDLSARLASAVAEQQGVPEAARAAVEQRLRVLLESDPALATLLVRVGAG